MSDVYNLTDSFDVIFCRNVLIYFNRETQEQVINKLCIKLKKGGYLFIGHSESILGMNLPLEQIKPTIFRRI
jgi:chemotaxis protein methyltransferase CheR